MARPLVTIHIPSRVEDALKKAKQGISYINLRGYGGTNYMAIGRVLTIAHVDGSCSIEDVVLPFSKGETCQRSVGMDRQRLKEGEHFEVVSIFKCVAGVWFIREPAQGYHPEREVACTRINYDPRRDPRYPAKMHFPVIRKANPRFLQQLTTFTGIEFTLNSLRQWQQYVGYPLGDFTDMYRVINDEREFARQNLDPEDVAISDMLIANMQAKHGYLMTLGQDEPVPDEIIPEQVAASKVAPQPFRNREQSIREVAEAHRRTLPAIQRTQRTIVVPQRLSRVPAGV